VQRFDLPADGSGSLLVLDWVTSGRMGRGETWAFDELSSRNEVFLGGRLVFLDTMLLKSSDHHGTAAPARGAPASSLSVGDRMSRFHVCGLLFLVGPETAFTRDHIRSSSLGIMQRAELSSRGQELRFVEDNSDCKRQRKEGISGSSSATVPGAVARGADVLCSASDVFVNGGDEHSCKERGVPAPALVVRFACTTTDAAHDLLLAVLAPMVSRLGRLPFGPTAT
jgi:hypothetical protein